MWVAHQVCVMYEGQMDFVGTYNQLRERALEEGTELTSNESLPEPLRDTNDELAKSVLSGLGDPETEQGWDMWFEVGHCVIGQGKGRVRSVCQLIQAMTPA